jgi:hypothetical protein
MVAKATKEAFIAVFALAFSFKVAVIVIYTGIVPKGFINVKKEVKHKSPKEIKSFISIYQWLRN